VIGNVAVILAPKPPVCALRARLVSGAQPESDRVRLRRAFTLIELLVVLVVLGVLAGIVAPNVFRHVSSAKSTAARSQIEMLGAALDAYRLDTGTYPTTEQGLAALVAAPAGSAGAWRGPYLRKALPLDPWRNAYAYKFPGTEPTSYELVSYGADGKAGGDGDNADIASWK
jgi:general secretion pathway protein G